MKNILIIAATATLAFTSLPAAAQQATSSTSSAANNTANQISASGAIASGGQANIVFPVQPANTSNRVSGSTTNRIESAPSLGGLAVGGGHPCAWTPGSGQFSIIGGGLGASQMTIDEACMLAVMAAASGNANMQNAAMYMIAGRSSEACKAMKMAGLIADCLTPREARAREAAAAQPTTSTKGTIAVAYNKCEMKAGKIHLTVRAGADKATAISQCKTALK